MGEREPHRKREKMIHREREELPLQIKLGIDMKNKESLQQ